MTVTNEEKTPFLPPEGRPPSDTPAGASQPSQDVTKVQPPCTGPPPCTCDTCGQPVHRPQDRPCCETAHGGGRLAQKLHDAAVPVNNWAVRMGTESFLPMPMELECDKAARILQSFCGRSMFIYRLAFAITG